MFRMNERVAVAIVVALAATAADAQPHRYQTSFTREIPYRAGDVTIDHRFGSLTITTGSSSQVAVRASIRASDPAFGQQIRIATDHTSDGVRIRTEYPERNSERHDQSSYSVDLRVTVPRGAPVRVNHRFGSLQATGIAGGSSLVNGHGSIHLVGGRGEQSIQNSFGSIQARDIDGNVHARNSHGSIHAERIRGRSVLENRFGSIHAEELESDATITNTHGSVHVSAIRAGTRIVSSFGSVDVEAVDGPLKVEANHSPVKVRGVSGNADVSTTHSVAEVADVRGALDVENQNGAIRVKGLSSPRCSAVTLRTSHSSIRVAIPANASYAVNARTTHGRIISVVPIASATTSANAGTVIGKIGSGGCRLNLTNSYGNITIGQE